MIEYPAIILPVVSLFIYALLFMVECGAPIFLAAPELLSRSTEGRGLVSGYIAPVWEATNVFLVFSFVSLMAFFPGAFAVWGHALAVPFFIFLAVMAVRVVGMLYVFYHGGRNRFMEILLVWAALASPVAFAAGIIPFFLVGSMPYGVMDWLLAFGLGGFALAATLFISFLFFEYLAARRGLAAPVRPGAVRPLEFFTAFFALCFMMVSFFVFSMLPAVAPHIAANFGPALLPFLVFSVLSLTILTVPRYRGHK